MSRSDCAPGPDVAIDEAADVAADHAADAAADHAADYASDHAADHAADAAADHAADAAAGHAADYASGHVAEHAAMSPQVGVAIVSWNVESLLRACLQSLLEGDAATEMRVVVVDNASADGTIDMLRTEFPAVTVVANDENRGFTAGNNQAFVELGLKGIGGRRSVIDEAWAADDRSLSEVGARSQPGGDSASPPYVLLLNPDTETKQGAVGELASYLGEHQDAAAVGPMLRYGDGSIQPSRRRFPTLCTGLMESTPAAWHWPDNPASRRFHMADVPPDVSGEVDWVTGAAILLRASAIEEVGGFDEGFFMYSEELDLCRRLRDRGWRVHYDPAAVVTHHEGRSSEQVVPARHLHFQRSRVRYFRKHHGRLSAAVVRGGVLLGYAIELGVEAAKWLVGHRRPLRRERMSAYIGVLRDGLG